MFQTTNQWILRCPKYPNTFFGCSPHFLLLTCGFCREVISTPPRRYHPEHVMQNKSSQTRNQQNKWCRPEATFFYAYDSYDHDISPLFSPEIQAQKTSTMVIYIHLKNLKLPISYHPNHLPNAIWRFSVRVSENDRTLHGRCRSCSR